MFFNSNKIFFAISSVMMFLLLISGNSVGYITYIRDKAANFINKATYEIYIIESSLSNLYKNSKNLLFIYDENISLKQNNLLLKYEIQRLKSLEFENKQLKKQVNLAPYQDFGYVSARVMTNVIGPYNYSAMITAGSRDGLKEGNAVINHEGLVGKIIAVYEKTASVLLITDLNSKISVMTSNFLEKTIISGGNKNKLQLLYLNDYKKVSIGEMLVTNNNGGLFPEGIPTAIIESIKDNEIIAKPMVDMSQLDYVRILVK